MDESETRRREAARARVRAKARGWAVLAVMFGAPGAAILWALSFLR